MLEEDKIEELRANRRALGDKISDINEQIREINDKIDEIYFKSYGIDKYIGHLVYFERDIFKYLVKIKDIKRLVNHRVRIIGSSIVRYGKYDIHYYSEDSIDMSMSECNNLVFKDDLEGKLTDIMNTFYKLFQSDTKL